MTKIIHPTSSSLDILLPAEAKGLVFDLDGTILDTMRHHWEAWRQTTTEYGIQLDCPTLLSLAGKPSSAIMKLLCDEQGITNIDIDAAVRRKQDLYVSYAHDTKPIDVVLAVAKTAKEKGIPIAVATGGSKKQVVPALKAAGLTDFFHAVVTCDDVDNGKPHPETFLKAAKLINVEPEHCVGYEDAPLGMEAIQNAKFLAAINVTTLPEYPKLV